MSELNLEPGKQLSPAEKEALAKENERETQEALAQAAQRREEDIRNGQRPVVSEVADSIKEQMVDRFGEDGSK